MTFGPMTFPETVELPNQPIFERLEAARQFGLITDYLLNWRGDADLLTPAVTVWSTADTIEAIREQMATALDGLVNESQIEVLEDFDDLTRGSNLDRLESAAA